MVETLYMTQIWRLGWNVRLNLCSYTSHTHLHRHWRLWRCHCCTQCSTFIFDTHTTPCVFFTPLAPREISLFLFWFFSFVSVLLSLSASVCVRLIVLSVIWWRGDGGSFLMSAVTSLSFLAAANIRISPVVLNLFCWSNSLTLVKK